MGMTLQELTSELAERLEYEGQHGVLVSDVDPDGPAAKVDSPPRRGDLIREVELQEIRNMKDFKKVIKEVEDPKKVMVSLHRASTGMTWYIVIKDE